MASIALCHKKCFKGTFIASWTLNLIANYYNEFLIDNDIFILAEENGDIVGFCMGYISESKAKSSFIKKNKYSLFFCLLKLCLSGNRIAINKCINTLINRQNDKVIFIDSFAKEHAEADLLSICVIDQCKGKGVSLKLVELFEKKLKEKSLLDYSLFVYNDNIRAQKFYEKNGLICVKKTEKESKYYKKLN